jgi:hypothetical protein
VVGLRPRRVCDAPRPFMTVILQSVIRQSLIRSYGSVIGETVRLIFTTNLDLYRPDCVVDLVEGHMGPCWKRAPIDAYVCTQSRSTVREDPMRVQLILQDGSLSDIDESEIQRICLEIFRRYGTDDLRQILSMLPRSRTDEILAQFQVRFPGVDLGRYVKMVPSVDQVPRERYTLFPEGRRYFERVRRFEDTACLLACVDYVKPPVKAGKPDRVNHYSVACRK